MIRLMMMITIIRWSSVYRNVVPRQMWQTPGSRGAWRRPQILLKRDPLIYHSCHQHFCHHHDQLSSSFIIFLIIGKLDIGYCLVYEFSKKNTGETMFLFNSGWKSKAFCSCQMLLVIRTSDLSLLSKALEKKIRGRSWETHKIMPPQTSKETLDYIQAGDICV